MRSMASTGARTMNLQGVGDCADGGRRAAGESSGASASRGAASSLDASADPKERVLARIKHNFHLEAQSFRQRIHEATEETARAKDKADALQEALSKWKKRGARLQRRLDEKDAALQELQQRRDVHLPMLLDEALRGVQSHLGNQSDDLTSLAQPLSRSAASEKAKTQVDSDERVHEYERQISALYEELEQEKQRTAMLDACLQEQKAEKHKYMKACKRAKLELQTVRDSGLDQMLADVEAKCAQLEQEKECLTESLQQKQATIRAHEEERDEMLQQCERLRQDAVVLQGVVDTRDAELARLRGQIRHQQETMENLQADLQESAHRLSLAHRCLPEDTEEQLGLTNHALRIARSHIEALESEVAQLKSEVDQSRSQQRHTAPPSAAADSHPTCKCCEVVGSLSEQINEANRKVLVLGRVLEVYIDTDTIDLTPLDELRWPSERDARIFPSSDHSELATRVADEMDRAVKSLEALQHAMEETLARAMGSSCAMQ